MIDRKFFPEHGCRCASFGDEKRFAVGVHLMDPLAQGYEAVRSRNPWLQLVRCGTCGTFWYVATDTDEGDIYFVRMNEAQVRDITEHDSWPPRFDAFKNVWPV